MRSDYRSKQNKEHGFGEYPKNNFNGIYLAFIKKREFGGKEISL